MPEESDEFTFTEDAEVDGEGYVISEEERAAGTESESTPKRGPSSRGRTTRRDRS